MLTFCKILVAFEVWFQRKKIIFEISFEIDNLAVLKKILTLMEDKKLSQVGLFFRESITSPFV
jgi:hypothetical protein